MEAASSSLAHVSSAVAHLDQDVAAKSVAAGVEGKDAAYECVLCRRSFKSQHAGFDLRFND